jgi:hypothetical protein
LNDRWSSAANVEVRESLPATALQRAWLQAQAISKRGGDPAFEGNYVLPFQMRITAH